MLNLSLHFSHLCDWFVTNLSALIETRQSEQRSIHSKVAAERVLVFMAACVLRAIDYNFSWPNEPRIDSRLRTFMLVTRMPIVVVRRKPGGLHLFPDVTPQ